MKSPITPIEYAFVATVGIGAIMGMVAWVNMIERNQERTRELWKQER